MLHNPYNSHYFQVPHPSSPYIGDIPNGVTVGKQIFVSGEATGDVFQINLLTPCATALHLNPRIHLNHVVRNTKFGDEWGSEETDGPQPFELHHHFEVIIRVEEERFLIAVNGRHCYEYQHRTSFEEITDVEVKGDVHVNKIVFSGGENHRTHKHVDNQVPFLQQIHGMHPRKMIQILGDIPYDCGRFVVNIQDEPSPANNIPLHFSARFDDPYTGEAVVVTNKYEGDYGEEIRDHHSPFPFKMGAPFEMLILCEHNEWKVAINGHHFAEMGHRNPLHHGGFLAVEGDVHVRSIREY